MHKRLIFIPTKDYSITNQGKSYAIFLCIDAPNSPRLIKCKNNTHVTISARRFCGVAATLPILFAAKDQSLVEVEVKIIRCNAELQLVGLTIPAI